MESSLEKIAEIIKTYKTFAIYTHVHTDIDAIASSLALKHGLESMGKTVHIFVDSEIPTNTYFLQDATLVNNQRLNEYDVAVVLDLSDESRLGRLKYKYKRNVKTTICIDHHLQPHDFCKYSFFNSKVSSTCEIIYSLLNILNVKINFEICKCLMSGILTDTGCLKFSSAYPSTFKIIGELLEKSGKLMDEITYPLFNSKSMNEYQLWKLSIEKTELCFNNKAAIIFITQEDFDKTNTSMKDTKGLTDNVLILESIQIVVMASEDVDGKFYISIRTKSPYSAINIATDYGGSGHLKAAGCKIAKPIEDVKSLILKSIEKELNK